MGTPAGGDVGLMTDGPLEPAAGESVGSALAVPGKVDEVDAALAALSPKQRARVVAFLGGESKTAIAQREGVSPQAIDQTLAFKAVRRVYALAIHRYLLTSRIRKDGGGEAAWKPLVPALLENLTQIALGARHPVRVSDGYQFEPDWHLRYQATLKLLAYVEADADGIVAREESTISRREVRAGTASLVRKSAPGAPPGTCGTQSALAAPA